MADDVTLPTRGQMVRVIGPGTDAPAVVTGVYDEPVFGPLVISVVVFHNGGAAIGYLDHSDITSAVSSGTLPHESTRDKTRFGKPGPCYWIWPTEA